MGPLRQSLLVRCVLSSMGAVVTGADTKIRTSQSHRSGVEPLRNDDGPDTHPITGNCTVCARPAIASIR